MSARELVLLSIAVLGLGACRAGADLDDVRSARYPAGARATLHTRNDLPIGVELLMAGDSVLTVMHHDSVKEIRWRRLTRVKVDDLGQFTPPFDERDRARLLRLSRFPYGWSAETRASVLRAAGQTEIAVIE